MSQTISYRGAKLVTLEQLAAIKAPSPEGRWHPIDHAAALSVTEAALEAGGYRISGRELYVLRSDARFVALLDLEAEIADRTSLVVGITSSTDQSLPFSFFAGYRSQVTGCSSFRSDLFVKRKHMRAGKGRFSADVATAVDTLPAFADAERARVERMKRAEVGPRAGDSVILRVFELGIISARALPHTLREWRKPPYEEFAAPTFWSLANVLSANVARSGKKEVYRKHVKASMQLNALLDDEPELRPAEEAPAP